MITRKLPNLQECRCAVQLIIFNFRDQHNQHRLVYAVRALTTAFAGLGAAGGVITVTIMALGVLANAWLVNSCRIEKMRGDLQSLGKEL